MKSFLFFLMLSMPALATEADEVLADPVLEARARALSSEIRCIVCAAQSVEDSPAPLAQDLRRFIRTGLQAGQGEDAIKQNLRVRYGDQILMSPPMRADTWLLWIAPGILLLAGIWVARKLVRRDP